MKETRKTFIEETHLGRKRENLSQSKLQCLRVWHAGREKGETDDTEANINQVIVSRLIRQATHVDIAPYDLETYLQQLTQGDASFVAT